MMSIMQKQSDGYNFIKYAATIITSSHPVANINLRLVRCS